MPGPEPPALAPAPLSVLLHLRLALLLFLSYAVIGAWLPLFALHLTRLSFTPAETAWACSTNALGALLAPLLWGQVADRWLAAERCVALCALAGAALQLALACCADPIAVFLLALAFWFFAVPTLSLGVSLVLRQLPHPERDYGKVRLWGTVGWAAAGLLLSVWYAWLRPALVGDAERDLADSIRLGALFSVATALYALTLPHTPPTTRGADAAPVRLWARLARTFDAPLKALRLLRRPRFAVYFGCLFGAYVTMPFPMQLNPLLLSQLDIPDQLMPVALLIAQSSEIVTLALLPALLSRLRLTATMALGITAWALGLAALGLGRPSELVLAALATHGVFICCFVVAGQLFVHRKSPPDVRASVQGLVQLVAGSGLFLGSLAVGSFRTWSEDDFAWVYGPAALAAAALAVLFVAGFYGGAPRVAASAVGESLVPGEKVT